MPFQGPESDDHNSSPPRGNPDRNNELRRSLTVPSPNGDADSNNELHRSVTLPNTNDHPNSSNELHRPATVPRTNGRQLEYEVGSTFGNLVMGGPPPPYLHSPVAQRTNPMPVGMNAEDFYRINSGMARAQATGMPSYEEMVAAIYDRPDLSGHSAPFALHTPNNSPVRDGSFGSGTPDSSVGYIPIINGTGQGEHRFLGTSLNGHFFLGGGSSSSMLGGPSLGPHNNPSNGQGEQRSLGRSSSNGQSSMGGGSGLGIHDNQPNRQGENRFHGNDQLSMGGGPRLEFHDNQPTGMMSENHQEIDLNQTNMHSINGGAIAPSQLNGNGMQFHHTDGNIVQGHMGGGITMTTHRYNMSRLHREAGNRLIGDGMMVQGTGHPVDGPIQHRYTGINSNGLVYNDPFIVNNDPFVAGPFVMNGNSDLHGSQVSSSVSDTWNLTTHSQPEDGHFGLILPNSMLGAQDVLQRVDTHLTNGTMNAMTNSMTNGITNSTTNGMTNDRTDGTTNGDSGLEQTLFSGLDLSASFDSAYASAPNNSSQEQSFNSSSTNNLPSIGSFNSAEYEEESPFDCLANEISLEYHDDDEF